MIVLLRNEFFYKLFYELQGCQNLSVYLHKRRKKNCFVYNESMFINKY